MCGLLIWITKSEDGIDTDLFRNTLNIAKYRGPDKTSVLFLNNSPEINEKILDSNLKSNIAIGHNRLALVDLSSNSDQPFFDYSTERYFLFNGEYFNFKDKFPSYRSDGKALFDLINKNGFRALNEVEGMYALAIIDLNPKNREIIIARDSYGKKPLYFYIDDQDCIISSDFSSIHSIIPSSRKLNKKKFGQFISTKNSLNFQWRDTIWQKIKSVKPGRYTKISIDNLNIKSEKTFSNWRRKTKIIKPVELDKENFCLKELRLDINKSVDLRVNSDADIAVCISGGIDSSLVAYFANEYRKKHNKNIGFYTCLLNANGKTSEDLYYSRLLAKKLNVKLVEVNPFTGNKSIDAITIIKAVTKIVKATASPINLLNSTLTNYFLCKKVKEDGFKAILDGVGGDEIMGGYPIYSRLFLANIYNLNFKNSAKYLNQYLQYEDNSKIKTINIAARILIKSIFLYINKKGIKINNDPISKKINSLLIDFEDFKEVNDGIENGNNLLKFRENLLSYYYYQEFEICNYQMPFYHEIMDSSSMVNSVENRSPFLDQRLIKYLYMPDKYKHRNGLNKFALRSILKDIGLDFIAERRKKEGNSSPFPIKAFSGKEIKNEINQSEFLISLIGKDHLENLSMNPYFNSRFLSFAILFKEFS